VTTEVGLVSIAHNMKKIKKPAGNTGDGTE
jgi:hypothetical protein